MPTHSRSNDCNALKMESSSFLYSPCNFLGGSASFHHGYFRFRFQKCICGKFFSPPIACSMRKCGRVTENVPCFIFAIKNRRYWMHTLTEALLHNTICSPYIRNVVLLLWFEEPLCCLQSASKEAAMYRLCKLHALWTRNACLETTITLVPLLRRKN